MQVSAALPLMITAVGIAGATALGVAQSGPVQPWEVDRSDLPIAGHLPAVDCGSASMTSGTLDYAAEPTRDELDPVARARSVLALDPAGPPLASIPAHWVDVSRDQGAVAFTDTDGATRAFVEFALGSAGWYATGMMLCGASSS